LGYFSPEGIPRRIKLTKPFSYGKILLTIQEGKIVQPYHEGKIVLTIQDKKLNPIRQDQRRNQETTTT
jgi:hypothetical protein